MTTPPPEKNTAPEMVEAISHQTDPSTTNDLKEDQNQNQNQNHDNDNDNDGGNTNTSSQPKHTEHQVETPASLTADSAFPNTSSHEASSKPDRENTESKPTAENTTNSSGPDNDSVAADAAKSGSANSDTQSGQPDKQDKPQDTQAKTSEAAKSVDVNPNDTEQVSESAGDKKDSEEKAEKSEKPEEAESKKTQEEKSKDEKDTQEQKPDTTTTTTTQEATSKSEETPAQSAQQFLSSPDSHELPVRNASAQPEPASKPEPPTHQSTSAAGPAVDSAPSTTAPKEHNAENDDKKLDKDGDTNMDDGEAAAAPSSQPQAPPSSLKRSADEMEADNDKQSQPVKQETPAPPVSHDTEMTDADNLSPGTKAARDREEGDKAQASEEPAAKRAKVEGEEQEKKIPPPSTPAAPTTAPAPAPTPATVPQQTQPSAPGTAAPAATTPAAPSVSAPSSTIKPEVKAQTSSPMTKLQHRFLIRCIGGLKRTHDARFYKEPVDTVKMNIPSYYTIITQPIDMGTMEQKLKAGQYGTVDDVIADFDLMVNNAITFNGEEHPVAKEGINLRASFNRHLSKLPGVDEVEPPAPEKKRSGAKKSGGNRKSSGGGGAAAAKRESRPSGGRASIASQGQTFALSPEGLPLIRRDSTTADGRPKRSIHPPKNRDLPYSAKPKKKKYVWELKFCQEVLDELFKPKHYQYAAAFYLPVDPVALNIPNYHSIIKRPMDLGTIQNKLKANLYENAKEFEADVRLVFKNCYKFNIVGDPTYTAGQKLNEVFDKKWATKDRWLHAHEPPNVRHEHDSVGDSEDEPAAPASDDDGEESEADVDEEKLAALRRQMEELTKQVEVLSQKKKKTPPAPKKKGAAAAGGSSKAPRTSTGGSSKKASAAAGSKAKKGGAGGGAGGGGGHGKKEKAARWVSYQEKQLISNVISTLPEKQMNEALSIIQRNAPSLIGSSADGEIELDIDELPNEVLLKLLNFVKKHVPQAVAELENPSISSYSHHSHAPPEPEPLPSLAGNGRPRKNKPMNASEQEAQINRLEDRLEMFKKGGRGGGVVSGGGSGGGAAGGYGGMNTVNKSVEMDSSDDEDSEESEEE